MSTIKTKDGTEIYDKDWGAGQPVVFCRGGPFYADAWETQMVYLASKRQAIGQMIARFDLSERRTCRPVGLTRDSYRHPPIPDQTTVALGSVIIDIAQARRRFGYRRIHDLVASLRA